MLFLILLVSNFKGFFPQQTFRYLLKVNYYYYFASVWEEFTSMDLIFVFFLFLVFYKKFHKMEGHHSLLV